MADPYFDTLPPIPKHLIGTAEGCYPRITKVFYQGVMNEGPYGMWPVKREGRIRGIWDSYSAFDNFTGDGWFQRVNAYWSGGELGGLLPDRVFQAPYLYYNGTLAAGKSGPAVGSEIRTDTGAVYSVQSTTVQNGEGVLTLAWKAWK